MHYNDSERIKYYIIKTKAETQIWVIEMDLYPSVAKVVRAIEWFTWLIQTNVEKARIIKKKHLADWKDLYKIKLTDVPPTISQKYVVPLIIKLDKIWDAVFFLFLGNTEWKELGAYSWICVHKSFQMISEDLI